MAQSKLFRGFLVLNWKNKKVRAVARRPSTESPYEISVEYSIQIEIPDKPSPKIEAKIEMPQTKINQAIAEEI